MVLYVAVLCYNVSMKHQIGEITIKEGANVWPHEMHTAKALARKGYNVTFIKAHNSVNTADAYINNTLFEFKSPEGCTSRAVQRNIVKALNRQSCNVVIDSFRMKKIQDRSIQSFMVKRLKEGKGIKRLIFVNRKGEAIDINELV